jgi:hypothetical protein
VTDEATLHERIVACRGHARRCRSCRP